ncbi:MAG: NAD(+) synthase [Lachnospiraceae bacterium]|nr:NAD(+) synthase [Lachnospiraceae bacterium]
MKYGFVKAAAAAPKIRVADPKYNAGEIIRLMKEMWARGARIIVFPELCITGYTCSDLFRQELLLTEAKNALSAVVKASAGMDGLFFVGLPMEMKGKLYNVAAAYSDGRLLGLVPKTHIPNYSEFYEQRHFTAGPEKCVEVEWLSGEKVPFGTDQLFSCADMPRLEVAAEICEDVWAPNPPGVRHAMQGATVIVNLSASDEITGKDSYRRELVRSQSGRLVCGYIYASAGEGESSTDLVFGGHHLICENGSLLRESRRFENETIYADLDIERLAGERRHYTTYQVSTDVEQYVRTSYAMAAHDAPFDRFVDRAPFVPGHAEERQKRCEEIFAIQSLGLKKRMEHTNCKSAVIGISGGLDSTLALLVAAKAADRLGLDRSCITAVTMPCFGTTDRTYHNACELTRRLGANLREVDIREAVNIHFRDIGHDDSIHDVTYENSQARERTQILMDIANQTGGMVIGTGDMSELALGWATYNGDHMSMYGVNVSVPKTLVHHLVRYYADTCGDESLTGVLLDILDTPVSPELLPPENGTISQKTEDLVGPYELHDFFLYYMLRFGFAPDKIYYLARQAFAGEYADDVILKWLKTFVRRFFAQQFKRSCLPDGPKVGTVAVSPRGDLRMPSDACARVWLDNLENLEAQEVSLDE